ncbi:MAG TPA: 30S ribosome-binding factor RbfA [Chloroflexota bacterium]|nr:30S ribosome-binding factor RbfA [Chloroflexota bacterium]
MSRRTERVQSLIRHELGQILQQELKDPRIEGLVSITAVHVTPDLRRARVFLSVYGSAEAEQHALQALTSAKAFLRHELGHRVGLRYAPELDLHIDHSLAYADEVSRILKNLPPPAPED